MFRNEAEFEEAVINLLTNYSWEKDILKYPTEQDLISNWANILYENNRSIDRLNNFPLTDGEMHQILEQIFELRTPLKLNGFINGKTVCITRDNSDDKLHFGKEISLKIFDRKEIAAGQSRYQIAQQPVFARKSNVMRDRRGDLMLLINGMPVFHIELKASGVPISQACNQIEKYAHEGIFTGIYSLVQVFVAMNPDETVYFANPGPDGKFNDNYYFHWADFNNEPINDWKNVVENLLSIPMAHQLIGFYTVADDTDGILKVMRSYQYYAASAISDKVSKTKWSTKNQRGGYIWHTTGSGKTMTSFKSAQLIATSKDADKVVFLTDRIELGTQSLKEYRGFASDRETVQATENTYVLIDKLKSNAASDVLIVTSIQKMSNIKDEEGGLNQQDIDIINKKRLVFIVDEAHRSTFGDMLITIKKTFPNSIFFGFTGTPIQEENQKFMSTTTTVFGDELHRYSIADGIRDGNVLGFDPYKVLTFKDKDLRRAVALERAKASTEVEAISDPKKAKIYYEYMDSKKIKMTGEIDQTGNYIKGIEDFIPKSQYQTSEHEEAVVQDIKQNWVNLSHNSKFHAIFATQSIPEAISYYRLIKKRLPELNVTCLFDASIDNEDGVIFKEDALIEILEDYKKMFDMDYSLGTHGLFKKDVALRLAHKRPYLRIEEEPDKQINILIVVNQMLTGFDSKWINTLYIDKMMEYENIIQAFSRTNRLFGPDKPFGTIRYYRKPHTMEKNIEKAVKLYSGDRPLGLFVDRLVDNLKAMNALYVEISDIFNEAGNSDFDKLPNEKTLCAKFALLFKKFNDHLEAARIQGYTWKETEYSFTDDGGNTTIIKMELDETQYLILVKRYQELFNTPIRPGEEEVPYDLDSHITEIDTDRIDSDYMNSRFQKYLKALTDKASSPEEIDKTLMELHKTFATLTQEEQKYADIFLHDIQKGEVVVDGSKTMMQYIIDYQYNAKNDQIHQFADVVGVYEDKLRAMMSLNLTESNINEFGRLDDLKSTIDKEKACAYFEKIEGKKVPPFIVNMKMDSLLRKFILTGGFEL